MAPEPLRIHTQTAPDECTSCALAAIAEYKLGQFVDPNFIYRNSKDNQYGIAPNVAVDAVISKGVRLEKDGSVVFPFKESWKVWSWFNWYGTILKLLEDGPLFCGINWQNEWSGSKDGTVWAPKKWLPGEYHAFCLLPGPVEIGGIIYLRVQNSRGEGSGDNGIWYFPKEVVNKLSFAYQLS